MTERDTAIADTLLSTVAKRWAAVCKENNADSEFLEEAEVKRWKDFEAKQTKRLKKIIAAYDGNQLDADSRSWLSELDRIMDNAKQVHRDELKARHHDRLAAEERKRQEEEERKEAERRKAEAAAQTRASLLGLFD